MLSRELDKISRTIIKHHRDFFGESPSPMKLQKLCYYSQGYFLAYNDGKALFPDDFEAWVYGPVVRDLYQKYKRFEWKAIDDEIVAEEIVSDEDALAFLDVIVESYGRFDGAALSTMTPREEPWIDARGGIPDTEGSDAIISKASMHRYFQKQLS